MTKGTEFKVFVSPVNDPDSNLVHFDIKVFANDRLIYNRYGYSFPHDVLKKHSIHPGCAVERWAGGLMHLAELRLKEKKYDFQECFDQFNKIFTEEVIFDIFKTDDPVQKKYMKDIINRELKRKR